MKPWKEQRWHARRETDRCIVRDKNGNTVAITKTDGTSNSIEDQAKNAGMAAAAPQMYILLTHIAEMIDVGVLDVPGRDILRKNIAEMTALAETPAQP